MNKILRGYIIGRIQIRIFFEDRIRIQYISRVGAGQSLPGSASCLFFTWNLNHIYTYNIIYIKDKLKKIWKKKLLNLKENLIKSKKDVKRCMYVYLVYVLRLMEAMDPVDLIIFFLFSIFIFIYNIYRDLNFTTNKNKLFSFCPFSYHWTLIHTNSLGCFKFKSRFFFIVVAIMKNYREGLICIKLMQLFLVLV